MSDLKVTLEFTVSEKVLDNLDLHPTCIEEAIIILLQTFESVKIINVNSNNFLIQ